MTYFYKGAIHIHSVFSDGTGTIDEISRAAKEAGLDWIIITDHNKIGFEQGIYNGVYVLAGEEISPSSQSNHCMAFGIKEQIDKTEKPWEFLYEIKKQNGLSCICHPHESLERQNDYPPIRWEHSDSKMVDGVEIWNYFSNWTNLYNDRNILTQAYYYLFGNFMKNEPLKETLEMWDRLNQGIRECKFAIGGIDAHAIKYKKFFFSFPVYPYSRLFKTVINVIPLKEKLPRNFEKAEEIILNSIKEGRHFILDQRRGKDCEIYFCAHNKLFSAPCGDCIELDEDSEISVILPKKAEIRLIKDGELYKSEKAKRTDFKINSEGKYRIEIYINSNAWVFSNPITYIHKRKGV